LTLAAFAAERRVAAPCCGAVAAGRPASIDISCAQQQARSSSDGTDRQTDRQTDRHPSVTQTLAVPHYYASSANK